MVLSVVGRENLEQETPALVHRNLKGSFIAELPSRMQLMGPRPTISTHGLLVFVRDCKLMLYQVRVTAVFHTCSGRQARTMTLPAQTIRRHRSLITCDHDKYVI